MDNKLIWRKIQRDTIPDPSDWEKQIESKQIFERRDTDSGYVMQEHLHQFYELLICYNPVPLRHTVAGRAYETTTPFVLFRAPYLLHSTSALDATEYTRTNIGFHPNVLTEFGGICKLGRLANCWECVIPATTEKIMEMEPLITRLRRVRDPEIPKYVWISTLATLLWEISEMAEDSIDHEVESALYVQEILQYAVNHVEEDLRIDALAERFYVSRSKLKRDFQSAVEMPLHEYVTSIRLHRAKVLLAEDMPLSMIAERCGFGSDSSFAYMFHRRTGITPGEYRRQCRNRKT